MKIALLSFPEKDLTNPPLGIAYITSLLNQEGHEAIIVEGNNKTVKDMVEAVGRIKPDVVGISMDTSARMVCLEMAKQIKLRFNLPIIVGGPHATLLPQQILENYNFIDYLVRNEGEYTSLNLLNALEKKKSLKKIKGISYRDDGKIIHNPAAEPITDLDALPYPEYKFFNLMEYAHFPHHPEELKKYPTGFILTSRGCPHNCTFCSTSHLWANRIRFRTAKNVVGEIEELHKKYNVRFFCFIDDHFLADRKRAIEICKLIIEKGLHEKIKWTCNSEVNVVNEEVLSWAKKAGCHMIAYGVEDASEEGIKFFRKAHNMKQVFRAFKLTREAGIMALSYFIIGGDHESPENLKLKKQAIEELDPDITTASLLVAFPKTEVFEIGRKRGWWDYDVFLKSCVGKEYYNGVPIYRSQNMSFEQMFEAVAGFHYWWNKKKGRFKLKEKLFIPLKLLKSRDFHKMYSMGKAVLFERLKSR